ncbi:MAG: 2-amino-4-hydroxy-6-hydroxymethyldihydropteridine diphosphokinase [Gammaproteobacteria bacterium]|nr:2-amino-4-hydroxy-6-hydroxymethyldihydropteridine diphosphokinase [Gammaproteobacteria bacterium]NIR82747.1 2-amino-4-hydroxy-6-hydroxymethyldihydropteridine diphosphokinase [Gammaproteobacteria bacterium]NIR89611.1 2-amino-4-hydroxy-6-hydroxymethyldihydropteridine diphosphokinase [Gammaproteobacteria bacterium]NIU03907.1 2-amino-4-hydroxy-6-hydroxymethyldihydropteridine diphosphokinase [Gammaproteobacteria bacterium]NIV51223.1 2-amino-4-hydroxy-6-hydroxymethyldihydropteridine diphosphokinas
MVRAYVSLGSNIERERHIPIAVASLQARYGVVVTSSVYESEAVGFQGACFYNLVVGFDTKEGARAIARALRAMENRCGRDRTAPRFGSRTLDADLLLYGDAVLEEPGLCLPREEILSQAFVLRPLAEIAGHLRHPVNERTYGELWRTFAGDRSRVWPSPVDPLRAMRDADAWGPERAGGSAFTHRGYAR